MPARASSYFGGIQRTAYPNRLMEPCAEGIVGRKSIKALARNGTSQDIHGAIMTDSAGGPSVDGPYRAPGAGTPLLGGEDLGFLAVVFCAKVRDEIALANLMMKGTRTGIAVAWAMEKGDFISEKKAQASDILGRGIPEPARESVDALLRELDAQLK